MRKRVTIVLMASLVGAVAIYEIYGISAFGRHDREAAAYERSMRSDALQIEGTRVIAGSAHVTSSPGNGAYCWLMSTLEVSTPLTVGTFEQRLKAVDRDYVDGKITQFGERDGDRLLRIETGTLGEGGTLDLRCG
ncbi:hypothetical protein [Streptomyces sp. NPDC086777]|uniref:hypothetical protein n=1 Tax=Streptomyces sp. NPDC086777 TaxID=3154866 RepID=UPI00344F514E